MCMLTANQIHNHGVFYPDKRAPPELQHNLMKAQFGNVISRFVSVFFGNTFQQRSIADMWFKFAQGIYCDID